MWGPGRDISCRGVSGIIILPRVKLSTFPYARCCCAEYEEGQLEIIGDDGHGSDFYWVVTFKVFLLVIFVDINAKSSTVLIPGRTNHEYAHE